MKPKIFIIGHKRHGKDTVANMLNERGFKFVSSTDYVARHIVYPKLKHVYESVEDCIADRDGFRKLWYLYINEYVENDLTKLTKEIFKVSDLRVGVRNSVELEAAKQAKLVDYVIWVNASKRLPLEDSNSISVKQSQADYVIDNNGTEEDLVKQFELLIKKLKL